MTALPAYFPRDIAGNAGPPQRRERLDERVQALCDAFEQLWRHVTLLQHCIQPQFQLSLQDHTF